MNYLLNEIEIALDNGLYLLALQSSLTIPDICSALCTKNGETHRKDYIKWYNKWVEDKQLTGKDCYYYRCGMIHQGKMLHKDLSYDRILFIYPNSITMKNCIVDNTKIIDIIDFCKSIIEGAKNWWKTENSKEIIQKNYKNTVKLYMDGYSNIIKGIPVIT